MIDRLRQQYVNLNSFCCDIKKRSLKYKSYTLWLPIIPLIETQISTQPPSTTTTHTYLTLN